MKARNPVLSPDVYFPDGEPHYINGELYVYPSCDTLPGRYCSDKLYVTHSRDLSEWAVDGPAFACAALDWEPAVCYAPGIEEANGYEELPHYIRDMLPKHIGAFMPFRLFKKIVKKASGKAASDVSKRLLFAPDALTVGDQSYLFFCTSDGREGVAVSDDPAGPFADPVMITGDRTGLPINGIDPAVFRDDDGKVYLYWGQINACAAQLTDDLTKVREDTLARGILTEKEHCFHEGSSMRKRNGIYYYVFADTHRGKPTALGYATSKSPLGPFEYQGVIVDNADCDPGAWNNHGGIECVDGQWYVFYHRSSGGSRYLRRMCAEPIFFDENGKIREVPMTSVGMGDPYLPGEPLFGYQACGISGNAYIDGDKLMVKKGGATVVYRYVSSDCLPVSRIAYEGTGAAALSCEADARGELTIRIETDREIEIDSFRIQSIRGGTV